MGDPPPRSARAVLQKGASRTFVVQALDAPRRGVELALPGHAHVAGAPTEETVEAEILRTEPKPAKVAKKKAAAKVTRKKVAPAPARAAAAAAEEPAPAPAPVKKKAAAKKKAAPAKKKAAAKKRGAPT
jgi:hypothetical protein